MTETSPTSPLLSLPGAVAGDGVDAPVAAHYGSFNLEQRTLASGEGFVDLSHRDVVRIAGPDRLTWLHSLTSQAFEGLAPGAWTSALILSPQGHVEHFFSGVDDGASFLAWTEPGAGSALAGYLERMKFWSDVTVTAEPSTAVVWRGGAYSFVPRESLEAYAAAAGPACGFWAFEALRIERGEPRFGVDTDARTIPNEVGWVPGAADVVGPDYAVHLDKGCYRGQETVARVHTLGRPPRRLVLLHLDGSENRLPAPGSELVLGEKTVGFLGSSARHHELGPIALGLVKRNVPLDAQLVVDGMPVAQEVLVDPEIGLHIRPLRK
ncbi:folate-binding protein YgfZ [Nocardioides luteus]|uniref:Folate-binding protein n=1 Tax=Nocardioides luteus TaxID=1844 RepID=A0ABQ5SXL0_9ACTN|nr:folate-binding protein YgfZ [Nocardioides luteus]MDR7312310.1 folate-binding protein YgfZ [Nocardioides luteus]GGR57620.1 folate-binding protein [Nocardioides luteus]GLJ68556.1 folate-binding protein [Nocardioides luteus]